MNPATRESLHDVRSQLQALELLALRLMDTVDKLRDTVTRLEGQTVDYEPPVPTNYVVAKP